MSKASTRPTISSIFGDCILFSWYVAFQSLPEMMSSLIPEI